MPSRGGDVVRSLRTAGSEYALRRELREEGGSHRGGRWVSRPPPATHSAVTPSLPEATAVRDSAAGRWLDHSASIDRSVYGVASPSSLVSKDGRKLDGPGAPSLRYQAASLMGPCVAVIALSVGLLMGRGALMKLYQPDDLSAQLTGPIYPPGAPSTGSGAGSAGAGAAAAAEPRGDLMYIEQWNAPLGAFLGVTGLVYALIFSYSYQTASSRLQKLSNTAAREASDIMRLVLIVRSFAEQHAQVIEGVMHDILAYNNAVVDEVVRGETVLRAGPIERLYSVVQKLRVVSEDGAGDAVDRSVLEHVLRLLDGLSENRNARIVISATRIHIVVWGYLVVNAITVFFAVLLLQTGSHALDATLCAGAIAGFGASLLLLTDVSRPFWGCLQVNLRPLVQAQLDLEQLVVRHYDAKAPLVIQAAAAGEDDEGGGGGAARDREHGSDSTAAAVSSRQTTAEDDGRVVMVGGLAPGARDAKAGR